MHLAHNRLPMKWLCRAIKMAVTIPVIANGGVNCSEDVQRCVALGPACVPNTDCSDCSRLR
jgi:NAD(P)H-dependent flavin oxidoreductase YrpB (nitropropane dioxygenase family)